MRLPFLAFWAALVGATCGCQRGAPRAPASAQLPPPAGVRTADAARGRLVDAVKEIATEYPKGITPAKVQSLFETTFVPEGRELGGDSKRWPVSLDLLVPTDPHEAPLLRLAIYTSAGLTLADLESVLGKHDLAITAKESMVEFQNAVGVQNLHVIASLLGSPSPSSPVLRIEIGRASTAIE